MSTRKPTQKEIALAANVSQGLVSRILNTPEWKEGDPTRDRVMAIARELGYSPRSKATGRKNAKGSPKKRPTILYVPPSLSTSGTANEEIYMGSREFYHSAQSTLLDVATRKGCMLAMLRPEEVKKRLAEMDVDGVIYHAKDPALAQWLGKRFPQVEINQRLSPDSDLVMNDPEEMFRIVLDHLRQYGHERIAYATPAPSDYVLKRRREIYNSYLQERGLPVYEVFDAFKGSPASIYFSLPPKERPTALITGTLGAINFQRAVLKTGMSLPGELSLVGTDNIIFAATLAFVPLTTTDMQIEQIAKVAFNLILNRLEDPELVQQKVEIPPRLIQRESVAAPGDHSTTFRFSSISEAAAG